MAATLAVLLWLTASTLIVSVAYPQGLGNDRLGMNQFVRQMIGKPQETYIADTTLNRFINYAHQTTKLALGATTDVDIDTIVTALNLTRYALDTTDAGVNVAVQGHVAAVVFRANEVSGGEERALQSVPPEMIGRWGDAGPGDGYSVLGRYLLLSKSPTGSDTLFVYYSNYADTLGADASALAVAPEDQTAVALLTAAWVAFGDGDLQRGQLFYTMWKDHLALKGIKFPAEEPVVR